MYADRQHTRKSFIISSFTHLHQPSSERANRTKRCRAWWRTPPAPLASFCSRNSAMSDSTAGAVRSGHGRLGLGCILVRCINVHLPVKGQGQGHFYVVFQQPHSTSCPFIFWIPRGWQLAARSPRWPMCSPSMNRRSTLLGFGLSWLLCCSPGSHSHRGRGNHLQCVASAHPCFHRPCRSQFRPLRFPSQFHQM
jgi:hypothetical protein